MDINFDNNFEKMGLFDLDGVFNSEGFIAPLDESTATPSKKAIEHANIEEMMLQVQIERGRKLKIEKFYLNNTKLLREIIESGLDTRNGYEISVDHVVKDIPYIETKATIQYDGPNSSVPVVLTPWDKAVLDAVYTLQMNKYFVMTPKMISRVMTGDMNVKASKTRVEKIEKSLEKLRHTLITIDARNEMMQRGGVKRTDDVMMVRTASLLYSEKIEWVHPGNRRKYNGYLIQLTSLPYHYAGLVKQIIAGDMDVRYIRSLRDTDDNIVLKDYLYNRIAVMKSEKNSMNGRELSLQWFDKNTKKERGILADIGLDERKYTKGSWKDKKYKTVSCIETILENYKKAGLIKGFKRVTDSLKSYGTGLEARGTKGFLIKL